MGAGGASHCLSVIDQSASGSAGKPVGDVKSFREALNKSDPKRGVLLYLDRKGSKTFAVLKATGGEVPDER